MGEYIEVLEVFEEVYGYEFEIQFIYFEVVYEGIENYVDFVIGENGFFFEYGVIMVVYFNVSVMFVVFFELFEVMYIF